MRLFIAEKPDLAKAIATALSGTMQNHSQKGVGYYQKGDDLITWSFGHILELYEPHDYNENWKKWNLADLPFDIKQYKHKPKLTSKAQLEQIKKLINKKEVTTIMHCGDADDEGQILIDEILEYANNTKPVRRVLINDITPEAVRDEIAKAKSNSEFKTMSDRGFARSIADWIVGINLTRAYTKAFQAKGGNGVLSVGRVQTPILSLIVDRDLENDNFKSIKHYSITAQFKADDTIIKANLKTDGINEDKAQIQNLADSIKGKDFALSIEKTPKKEYPPLPYNLLILQTEASKLYGYSPKQTMQITQDLREKYQAISYNRSDCQYLPEKIFAQSGGILEALKDNFGEQDFIANANLSIKSKAFNDKNLSAHYGIIPLKTKFDLGALDETHKNIYTLIAKRFCAQFYEPREYVSYSITLKNDLAIFSASATKTTKKGFSEFFSKSSDDEAENEIDLDSVNAASANLQNCEVKELETKPRPRYTMTTLLKDLNQVAKYVKNEKIKALLIEKDKDKKGESGGIGTPATRSEMIEKLINQGFIEVSKDKKQNIKSTQLGKDLIKAVSPMLSNLDMTALWYEYQKAIEKGEMTKETFLSDVLDSVSNEIKNIKQASLNIAVAGAVTCPACKKGILMRIKGIKNTFWGCSEYKNGCKFTAQEKNGKPLLDK